MTNEIRSKFEKEIEVLEKMVSNPDLGLTKNQFNHRLVGILDGLYIAGAISYEERVDLYIKYKKRG